MSLLQICSVEAGEYQAL